MGAGLVTTGALLAAVEARITATVSGVTIGDFLDAPAASGERRAHKGVRVMSPGATYEGQGSGPTWQDATETVQIDMLHRVSPRDQITSRTDSLTFRDLVLAAVTDKAWMDGVGVVLRLTDTSTEYLGEWIAHTITLTARRRQALG